MRKQRSAARAESTSDDMNRDKRIAIFSTPCASAMPEPTTELDYANPFELLIAVILSAQATDVSVNKATDKLYPVAEYARGDTRARRGRPEAVYQDDRPLQRKAENIIKTCRLLIEEHGSEVPRTRAELEGSAGRGTQDSQRDPEHGVRRTDDRRRHPYLPRFEPHRPCAGQDAARSRKTPRAADARTSSRKARTTG